MVVRCTGACLDHNNAPLDLLHLNFLFRLRVIYPHMHKYELRLKCEMYGVQVQYDA
jgi:hypothetical protein